MKNIILVSFFICSSLFVNSHLNHDYESHVTVEEYCDGWKDGYCEGWKDVKGQYSICPVTPICPIAKIDCSSGYKCGYNRGFKAGYLAANK